MPDLDEQTRGEYVAARIGQERAEAKAATLLKSAEMHKRIAAAHASIAQALEAAYPELRTTDQRADRGVDIVTPHAAYQVKVYADTPRGREAVVLILRDFSGAWLPVREVVAEMERRGWRDADNVRDNPVRNALDRAVLHGEADKRSAQGRVEYKARIVPVPQLLEEAG